jgi:hypothetical protein
MVKSYASATLDEIVHPKWPNWAPIRHHFDVRSFGVNAWRGDEGAEVIERHKEGPAGHEELYFVVSGHAAFEIAGEHVDAPAGTAVYVGDPELERVAFARAAGTTVLSLGAWPDKPFEISEWERESFDG